MASTHTLTGNIHDLAGAPLDATGLRVTVATNLPAKSALIDKTTNSIHLGGKHADLDPSTGLFSIDLIDTSATDLNVAANTLQYEVRAQYVNPATRVRSTWTSGWFPFTAPANLADITTDVEPLAVESASTYALEAKGYRDETATISGLTGEDAAVAFLVEDSGSATAGALSATYAARKAGPRSLARVMHQHRPVLGITEQYPKPDASLTHKVLYAGTGRWYAWGHDSTLRFSTDQGRTWSRIYNGPTNGVMGRDGLFVKVTGGAFAADQCLITTWHPFDGSVPELKRSTDYGSTWTTVQGPTAFVKYLGPTSVCQSPVTGNLYAAEYVNATPAEAPTCRIMKSTDQGATWTTWKTLQRNYDTVPATGIMHPHGIQVDPIDNRIWITVGDAALSGGLYRLRADESDWDAVVTNAMTNATVTGKWCGAVGLMFFPTHIAWGVDQSYTGNLLRMARTEIGDPSPDVEIVAPLNSTAFYAARATTDHTEWVLSASQEGGPGSSRIDNAVHLYRVADNGATVDEVGSIPVHADTTAFSWAFPLGTPLGDLRENLMWWGTNISDGPNQGDPYINGTQFAARMLWGASLIRRPTTAKVYEQPVTQTSPLYTALGAGAYRDWGMTVVPARATVLYIIEAGVKSWNGAGAVGQKANTAPAMEVWRTSPFGVAKLDGGTADASFRTPSRRASLQAASDAYIHRITGLATGEEIHFRIANLATATATADLSGHITYAWGY